MLRPMDRDLTSLRAFVVRRKVWGHGPLGYCVPGITPCIAQEKFGTSFIVAESIAMYAPLSRNLSLSSKQLLCSTPDVESGSHTTWGAQNSMKAGARWIKTVKNQLN